MIYLASPYSTSNKLLRYARYQSAVKAVAGLVEKGHVVYSPIVHWHFPAEKHRLPTSFDFWKKQNFAMIELCNSLWVLILHDWKKSKGVTAEIEYAKKLGKGLSYMDTHYVLTKEAP